MFTASDSGYGVTSTILYGPTEAMLVDAQFTVADAAALAQRISAIGRRLDVIFVTHPDADHLVGLSLLRERFPHARIYMSEAAIGVYRHEIADVRANFARSRRPNEAPPSEPIAEPLRNAAFDLDGHRVEILLDLQGDTYNAPVNSVVWIPGQRTLIAGDMAFDQVHVYLQNSSASGRAAWGADLSRLDAMHPAIVVAGHKRNPSSPHSPDVLAETREYLQNFERRRSESATATALEAAVQRDYPAYAYPLFLQLAARSAYEAR